MTKPHSDVLGRVVHDLAKAIDTPRSLAVWLSYKDNQQALIELPATDFASNDTVTVRAEYFITEYLKKYKGLDTGLDLYDVALEKWLASEEMCSATNRRFSVEGMRGFTPRASALLFKAQRKISSILGSFRMYDVSTNCKWASGATYDLPKRKAAPDIKITHRISVTRECLPFVRLALEHDPHWFYAITGVIPDASYCVLPACFKIVPGSRFMTVPKSAKTDRVIAKEPTGNAFIQQGLHAYMRRRLKRFGVDLDNQTRNQQLAQRAYTEGYATIDLSAASDTISLELVYHLVPLDWAIYMDAIRSKHTVILKPGENQANERSVRLEKFASMGNAFCFELESLIFYALARAVCGEDCSVEVYGDDIIVPQQYAEEVISLLELCGFKTNVDKTYTGGNFFESCGEHYHMGQSVTPPFQKEIVDTPPERVRMHNRLVRFGLTLPDGRLKRRLFKLCKWVRSTHPDPIVPLVPYGVQCDDGYLVDPLRMLQSYDKNHGFKCRVLVWQLTYKSAVDSALYAYKLRRHTVSNPEGHGRCSKEAAGRWVYKTRWIPESDITLE